MRHAQNVHELSIYTERGNHDASSTGKRITRVIDTDDETPCGINSETGSKTGKEYWFNNTSFEGIYWLI